MTIGPLLFQCVESGHWANDCSKRPPGTPAVMGTISSRAVNHVHVWLRSRAGRSILQPFRCSGNPLSAILIAHRTISVFFGGGNPESQNLRPRTITQNDSHFGLSNNKWWLWMWFPSCLKAGPWLKSVCLVQRSVAVWRCSAFIAWTGWTHAMTLRHDVSTINILNIVLLLLSLSMYLQSFSATQSTYFVNKSLVRWSMASHFRVGEDHAITDEKWRPTLGKTRHLQSQVFTNGSQHNLDSNGQNTLHQLPIASLQQVGDFPVEPLASPQHKPQACSNS